MSIFYISNILNKVIFGAIIFAKEDFMGSLDLMWILLSAFLVFLMQFGFSLIETGTVRTKNTINVAMKNLIDTVFGIMFFWLYVWR